MFVSPQLSALFQLYLLGKKLMFLVKRHNTDQFGQAILLQLVAEKPRSVSDLAQALSLQVSAATTKVLELEKLGLLERLQGLDKRAHTVKIAPAGEVALASFKKKLADQAGSFDFGLTAAEAKTLAALLTKITFGAKC